jgi:hypothetical protein
VVVEARLSYLRKLEISVQMRAGKLSVRIILGQRLHVLELLLLVDNLDAMFVLFFCRRIANTSKVTIHGHYGGRSWVSRSSGWPSIVAV